MQLCTLMLATLLAAAHSAEQTGYDPNLYEGDIVLSPTQRLAMAGVISSAQVFGASKRRWPGHVIPYEFAPEMKKMIGGVQKVERALNEFHRKTCLVFRRRTSERAYIQFSEKYGGCQSGVGHSGGRVRVNLAGPGCWQHGTIMHEIMHALGFWHEQNRPDRDSYVKILWENITPQNMRDQFKKRSGSEVDSHGTPYDYLSIMHYHKDGFGKGKMTIKTLDPKFQDKIGQRFGLSKFDVQQINKMYSCDKNFKTAAPIPTKYPLCTDKQTDCGNYWVVRRCGQSEWRDWALQNCKLTCRLCHVSSHHTTAKPTGSGCKDLIDCSRNKYYCTASNETLRKWAHKNCPRTCAQC